MKKLGLVLLMVAALASPAWAGQISIGSTYGPYQTGIGGEFTLTNVSGFHPSAYASSTATGESFQTFCVEATGGEYIYTNTLYNAQLNKNAVLGGTGSSTGDPVSVGTGWLYSQFAQSNLGGYNYGAGRLDSAAALQNTIWWLEGEGGDPGTGNIFRQAVVTEFGSQANAQADGGWTYGVYAINMWVGDNEMTGLRQDQLFYVPDGGTTLMLLGGALMGLGALRRKFRV